MIKLIVSDVNGTLVPGGSPNLDPGASDITLRLREKGTQLVVASRRPQASVESAFEPVKKEIFYVVNNGAYMGCHGRYLYAYIMDCQPAHRIVRRVHTYPELEVVYADVNGNYPDPRNDAPYDWLINDYKFNVIRVRDVLELEESCVKTSIHKKEGIETATRDIYEEFRDQTRMVCAGGVWMNCIVRDVNKGRAVRTIQENPGIKVEGTMTFEDQLNGIEVLNQTYYNFVVASVREEVRKVARFQADSNVRDGILKVPKGLLREKRDDGQKQDIQGTGEKMEKDLDIVPGSGLDTDCFYRVFQEDSCNSQFQNRG